jgi:hypothetical protein
MALDSATNPSAFFSPVALVGQVPTGGNDLAIY